MASNFYPEWLCNVYKMVVTLYLLYLLANHAENVIWREFQSFLYAVPIILFTSNPVVKIIALVVFVLDFASLQILNFLLSNILLVFDKYVASCRICRQCGFASLGYDFVSTLIVSTLIATTIAFIFIGDTYFLFGAAWSTQIPFSFLLLWVYKSIAK